MARRSRIASKGPSRTTSVSKELSAVLGDSSGAAVALADASTRTVASDAVSVAALLDAYLDENGHLVPAPAIAETMFADLPVDERRRRVNRARVLDTLRAGAWSSGTLAAYGSHVRAWRDWCDREGVAALPLDPYLVAQHLTEYALTFDAAGELVTDSNGAPIPRVSVSSVSGRLAALNKLAEFVGLAKPGDFPGVTETMRGIRRLLLVAKKYQKAALDSDGIRRCLAAAGGAEFNAVRLRSLILLRARTSISLVAASRLRWVDVAFTDEGVEISVGDHTQLVRHNRKEELCLSCTLLGFYDMSDTAANVFVKLNETRNSKRLWNMQRPNPKPNGPRSPNKPLRAAPRARRCSNIWKTSATRRRRWPGKQPLRASHVNMVNKPRVSTDQQNGRSVSEVRSWSPHSRSYG